MTMDEERFAEFLRRYGETYNRPPETPVEAIWDGIRASRDAGPEESDDDRVIPLAPRRFRGWFLPLLAAAAVLALGIALGRISMRQELERTGAAGPAVATRTGEPRPEAAVPESRDEPDLREDVGPSAGTSAPRLATTRPAPSAPATRGTPGREAPEPEASRTGRELYRLASIQMLSQAEAVLVDYRTGRASRRDQQEIRGWAKTVLSSTRLLLDGRAGGDPALRPLLEDLEFVLAQIVQSTGGDPDQEELIDRTIEDRDLMLRLRTAIPAGGGHVENLRSSRKESPS